MGGSKFRISDELRARYPSIHILSDAKRVRSRRNGRPDDRGGFVEETNTISYPMRWLLGLQLLCYILAESILIYQVRIGMLSKSSGCSRGMPLRDCGRNLEENVNGINGYVEDVWNHQGTNSMLWDPMGVC